MPGHNVGGTPIVPLDDHAPGQLLKVIYILGSNRSGTGILGRVLGIMEGTAHAGELRQLYRRGFRPGRTCGCGKPHAECEVWSKLLKPGVPYLQPSRDAIEQLQRRVDSRSRSRAWWRALRILRSKSPPSPDSPEGRYLAIYCHLYRAFAEATRCMVVSDNSKNPVDAALLALAPDVSAYCVQIVRDPRGVLFSMRKKTSPEDPTRWRPRQAILVGLYWTMYHLTNEAIRRRYGQNRSILVRYERFIAAPSVTVEAISRLVGVPPPTVDLAPGIPIELPVAHGPDSNGRFSSPQTVLTVDDRWRRELHPIDRFLVALVTYPLLRRYGYTVRTRSSAEPAAPVPTSSFLRDA